MPAPERATWDQKLGRVIRAIFSPLTGRIEGIDEWERARLEALDRQLVEQRDELRDRRATRAAEQGGERTTDGPTDM